jgi:hypothetical protein
LFHALFHPSLVKNGAYGQYTPPFESLSPSGGGFLNTVF